MPRPARLAAVVLALASAAGCARSLEIGRITGRNIAQMFRPIAPAPMHPAMVVRPDARLAVTWIGHATVLVQIDDRFILTDPLLSDTAAGLSRRLVAPGLRAEELPPLDAVVVSHMHFDHLSNDSIRSLKRKMRALVLPRGGREYATFLRGVPRVELAPWQTLDAGGGLHVTAVPVAHVGWRYGIDAGSHPPSFTGYVFEYHGVRVYFPGDTAWAPEHFADAARRLGPFDLALLPIAPIEPADFMRRTHIDPRQAVDAFQLLGARVMVPIHYDTLINSYDRPGDALALLRAELPRLGDRAAAVEILAIGEQRVLLPRAGAAP